MLFSATETCKYDKYSADHFFAGTEDSTFRQFVWVHVLFMVKSKQPKNQCTGYDAKQKENFLTLTVLASVNLLEVLCPQRMQQSSLPLPHPPKKRNFTEEEFIEIQD